MESYCKFRSLWIQSNIVLLFCRLRIITANMSNVIVGELICALWDHWQNQKQIRINTLSQHTEHKNAKLLDDHDHNQSISSRAPMLNHDERYILFPSRI